MSGPSPFSLRHRIPLLQCVSLLSCLLFLGAAPAVSAATTSQNAQTTDNGGSEEAAEESASDDVAWWHYADAVEAAQRGDAAGVARALKRLESHPGHPARERALALSVAPPVDSKKQQRESPTGLARAELAIVQTFAGIGAGLSVCGLAGCGESTAMVLSAMVGGGVGLGGALLLTRDGITQGHSMALNSGTLWGGLHALVINNAWNGSRMGENALQLGGLVGGTLVGHLLWDRLRPEAGDVSLANSGGIWLTALSQMTLLAARVNLGGFAQAAALLGALDLGLLGGSLLASWVPMSRGRALVIDAGGLFGALVGFGLAVLVQGRIKETGFFGLGVVGALGGLAGAGFLSQGWDLPDPPAGVRLGLIPQEGGLSLALGGAW